MQLPVVTPDPVPDQRPWYADGLRFTCTCCGNCCTGGPGFVWLSDEEIHRLAEHFELTPQQTVDRYCRKINGKWSLKESRSVSGQYDCIFLKEIPGKPALGVEGIVQPQRVCGIYAVRPLQCRTWPFWPENLESPEAWEAETRKCPGMNVGKHYPQARVETLRDAQDWPDRPPGSHSAAPKRA